MVPGAGGGGAVEGEDMDGGDGGVAFSELFSELHESLLTPSVIWTKSRQCIFSTRLTQSASLSSIRQSAVICEPCSPPGTDPE